MRFNEHLQYIRTVRNYERLAVSRSRLFQLFVLALTAFVVYLLLSRLTLADADNWEYRAAASVIPYMVMKYVSIIEAFFLVFLLSECRFNAFDDQRYSDVFLNHPPSNADYYSGKILGYMQLFCRLNLFLLLLTLVFNLTARQALVDVVPYVVYGVLYTVPMLLFVTGLATCVMLKVRHLPVVMLLVPGLLATMFLLSRQPSYAWLDFSAFHVPVFHSSMAGWIQPERFLVSRIVYLCIGLALCCLAVALVPRMSGYAERGGALAACLLCVLLAAAGIGYHQWRNHADQSYRAGMVALNDTCSDTPLWQIHFYQMDIRQQKRQLEIDVRMTGTALDEARTFAFCLNPGFRVDAVEDAAGRPLPFTRREQMLLVDFPTVQDTADTTAIRIRYHGRIDRRMCYLDMGDEWLDAQRQVKDIVMPASDVEQRPSYCLLTPDSYWYPRMGTAYTTRNYKWQRQWFSHFDIHVVPRPRLFPVTQGALTDTSDGYRYVSDVPVPSLTLAIGPYERITGETPSGNYHVVYQKGHDYFRPLFDGMGEEIVKYTDIMRRSRERVFYYLPSQYTLVEVPASFASRRLLWTTDGHYIQPQIRLVPEKAFGIPGADMYSAQQKSTTSSSDKLQLFERLCIELLRGLIDQTVRFNFDISAPWFPDFNLLLTAGVAMSYLNDDGEVNLLTEHSLAELLESHSIPESLLMAKLNELCFKAMSEDKSYWSYLPEILKAHPHTSLQLEQVFDMLADSTGVNLNDYVATWLHTKGVPYYHTEPFALIVRKDRLDTYYEISQIVTNESQYAGLVVASTGNNLNNLQVAEIPAHASRRFVLVSNEKPTRYQLEPLLSLNRPVHESYALSAYDDQWHTESGAAGKTRVEEVARPTSDIGPNEIIVDNEDPGFSSGYADGARKRFYAKMERPKDDYLPSGGTLLPELVWRSALNIVFWGRNIRSAVTVRSTTEGAPLQESVWKIPIPRAGRYIAAYYFSIPGIDYGEVNLAFPRKVLQQRVSKDPEQDEKEIRKLDLAYHFRFRQSSSLDKMTSIQPFTYNPNPGERKHRRAFVSGWTALDTLDLQQDTLYCTLSNQSDLRFIVADAIRLTPVAD
ncbi:MAG: hypothetical protein J6X20_00940 [Bacteroidales bacterium]|nr:hypothetical protein [Bacteroidales bacterium]